MRQTATEIISEFTRATLVFELRIPAWLCEDLYKIQAAQGVPLETLLIEQLEDFVIDNLDFKTNSFKKLKWDSEKRKPRLTRSGRSCTKKL